MNYITEKLGWLRVKIRVMDEMTATVIGNGRKESEGLPSTKAGPFSGGGSRLHIHSPGLKELVQATYVCAQSLYSLGLILVLVSQQNPSPSTCEGK